MGLFFITPTASFPAVLNVDNSVVDLETIEALYENVSSVCVTFKCLNKSF